VVLLDEIEKAHPEVFNVLLQLLDDGRLTDAQGRTVDFKNTLVIMTSNLGGELWSDPSVSEGATEQQVRERLAQHFRPEFLNRIDEVVVFHRLNRELLAEIVGIQLRRVEARLEEAGYHLQVSEAARAYLAEVGYDPLYGARPLKRAIQRELQDPLAMHILAGEFSPGQTIGVDRGQEGLAFSAAAEQRVDQAS
jgi:ATP-dependent Clp protease ATP-binding subunit ClpB